MEAMRKSRLSRANQNKLIKHFVFGSTARCSTELIGVNFKRFPELIVAHNEQKVSGVFSDEIEVDKSYFGGERKGKRGRGAAGKVSVYGLLKRDGQFIRRSFLCQIRDTLMPIMPRRIAPNRIV